jgi:hypothetical protein
MSLSGQECEKFWKIAARGHEDDERQHNSEHDKRGLRHHGTMLSSHPFFAMKYPAASATRTITISFIGM